jgi:hypothetical protein
MMNSWEAAKAAGTAGHPDIFISYMPTDRMSPGGWQVISPSHKTGPDGHWMHRGNKFFMGDKRGPKLVEAMDWASERYGITEWVKVPGFKGDYFPAEAAPAIKAARKAQTGRLARTPDNQM